MFRVIRKVSLPRRFLGVSSTNRCCLSTGKNDRIFRTSGDVEGMGKIDPQPNKDVPFLNQQDHNALENINEIEIQPEWLAMERRVAMRKLKRKGI